MNITGYTIVIKERSYCRGLGAQPPSPQVAVGLGGATPQSAASPRCAAPRDVGDPGGTLSGYIQGLAGSASWVGECMPSTVGNPLTEKWQLYHIRKSVCSMRCRMDFHVTLFWGQVLIVALLGGPACLQLCAKSTSLHSEPPEQSMT